MRNAQVTLLHVVETVTPQDLELYPAIINDDDSARELEARQRLTENGKTIFAGITHEVMVRRSVGSVSAEIVSVGTENPVSLIVMSAHSRGFFEKLFLESTFKKVVNCSRCPVLVVPV